MPSVLFYWSQWSLHEKLRGCNYEELKSKENELLLKFCWSRVFNYFSYLSPCHCFSYRKELFIVLNIIWVKSHPCVGIMLSNPSFTNFFCPSFICIKINTNTCNNEIYAWLYVVACWSCDISTSSNIKPFLKHALQPSCSYSLKLCD